MKRFPQKRGPASIFPAPDPDEVVEINPPSLQWVAEPDVTNYRVVVTDAAGKTVADEMADRNIFRFRKMLAPGRYVWNVFADGAELGERAFTVPENARPYLPPTAKELLDRLPAEHPRLRFRREDLPVLREKFADELAVLRRNAAAAEARPLMPYPDYYTSAKIHDHRSSLDRAREFLDRDTVACALVYLFDGDQAAGARAREAVLRVMTWNPVGLCSVRGVGGDEVGLSICRTMPSILDWTWELFTPGEIEWISETMAKYAADNYRRMIDNRFLADPGSSHLGRQPGYLGEAALLLAEFLDRETAEKYLDFALDVYTVFFPHYGGRGGGWAEGTFYGSSYTKWYLPFFFTVEHLTGFSFLAKPFYRHLADFFVHFAPPGQEAHPFGDGNWPTAEEWPGFQAQDPFGVYADRFGPETARRFSRELRAGVETYNLHLLDLIYPPGKQENHEETKTSFICRDTGFVSMRKCPGDPPRDIALLARCSRYGTPSHQHADQGNFAVMAGGKALLAPSGTFGYVFGENHHTGWTRQTVAHNCILIDGVGQEKNSAEAIGVIESFDGDTAVFDLSPAYPMLKRYRRTLSFDRAAGVMKVLDELESEREATVDFRLHSYSEPVLLADGRVKIERGGAVAEITPPGGEYSMTDLYEYGGVSYTPGERHHGFKQYHMNWRFPGVQTLRLETVIRVTLG